MQSIENDDKYIDIDFVSYAGIIRIRSVGIELRFTRLSRE